MSISAILPPATVKPRTEAGRPLGAATRPAAPLTNASRAWRASQANPRAAEATARAPPDLGGRAGLLGPKHDLGVEHRHEGVEVAVTGGGQEGADHRPLAAQVGVGSGDRAPDPAAGPA